MSEHKPWLAGCSTRSSMPTTSTSPSCSRATRSTTVRWATLTGVDAFKGIVTMRRASVLDVYCTVETWFESGDIAPSDVRVTGTHTGQMTGVGLTDRSFAYVTPNIGRVENDKAVEHWADQGMFQFLTQIGAIEPPAPAS